MNEDTSSVAIIAIIVIGVLALKILKKQGLI